MDCCPQLIEMHPEIGRNYCRLLHIIIEEVDSKLRPLSNLKRKTPLAFNEFAPPMTSINSLISSLFDSVTTGRKHYPPSFKFFFEDWNSNVPKAQNVNEIIVILKKILPYVGTNLSTDLLLFGKLIRIGQNHVAVNVPN